MKGLLELIKLIFGPRALSKTIGTRTNVIKLPNNKTKRYLKQDLNIEAASDAAAMNAKKEMEELVAEIPKMNDAERLIFEGNLRRLKNRLGLRTEADPTADVFQFGTKEKVTPGGIASLTEKAGQKSPPGTLMGNIESRIKQLEARGEDPSKMKGQTLDEIMGDVMQTQKTMSKMQDEGLVRAAVRYKMMDDLKRGTLKLPKNLEDVVRGASNEEDVITVFRNNYGEDALEQVDSLIPDFYKMTSPADAVKKIEKDFPNMKPKKIEVKQTMDLDEAAKAEQENILTPGKAISADSPEGKKITEALIGKPKAGIVSLPTAEKILSDMRKLGPMEAVKEANKVLKREGPYKNLTDKDIEKIMNDINDHIFGGDLPVDPEDFTFANGGRVSYSDGTKPSAAENTPSQEIINRMIAQIKQLSKRGVDVSTIKDIVGASDQMIKDVLGQASGGRIGFQKGTSKIYDQLEHKVPFPHAQDFKISSKGLDYLTGIERRGYAQGTLLSQYQKHLADITAAPLQSTVIPPLYINDGGDSSMSFTTPTKEESEATLTEGMTDVGENRFGGLGSMVMGGIVSAINPVLGMAYSLANPNSITRQALAGIGFNPVTQGSINNSIDNQVDVDAMDRDQAGDMGPSQAESEAGMSEGMSDLADGGIVRKKYADGGLNYLMGY